MNLLHFANVHTQHATIHTLITYMFRIVQLFDLDSEDKDFFSFLFRSDKVCCFLGMMRTLKNHK